MMNDKGKVFDIDPACRDIGGDEALETLFLEGTHDPIAVFLYEIALQDIHG